jgi:hypothetical protein
MSAAVVVRGCCRIETGSTTCPPGSDYQENELLPGVVYKYTRCKGDLCNDSDGTRDGDDKSGGVIVVDGVPEDYDWAEKTFGVSDDDDEIGSRDTEESSGSVIQFTLLVSLILPSFLAMV